MTLRMYFNDNDWVIAESPEEATKLYIAHCGDPGIRDDEWGWVELPLDKVQKLWVTSDGTISAPGEGDGAVLVSMTVAEEIEKFGRGYVGSLDF